MSESKVVYPAQQEAAMLEAENTRLSQEQVRLQNQVQHLTEELAEARQEITDLQIDLQRTDTAHAERMAGLEKRKDTNERTVLALLDLLDMRGGVHA